MKQKIIDFFNGVIKEMRKVTWPTRDELKESTTVVIVVCLIIAAFSWMIDKAVTQIIQGIF